MFNKNSLRIMEMDGKLNEHIALTQTLLEFQRESLDLIRGDLAKQSETYVTHDAAEVLVAKTLDSSEALTVKHVDALESRFIGMIKIVGGVIVSTILLGFGLVEMLPFITTGGS